MLFAYSESEDGKQLTVSCVQGPDALYVSSLSGWFLQPQLPTAEHRLDPQSGCKQTGIISLYLSLLH